MPVALSSKSGEFGEDSVNLMAPDGRSRYRWIPQISGWCIGAAAVCLGFLLLIVILAMVAHNSSTIGHRDSMCENMILSLTADRDSLRAERDQLQFTSSNLTKEMDALQSQYQAVVESRDKLQEEFNILNLTRARKACHRGWKSFQDKCYYFSPSGVTKSWLDSRKDCQERGVDLAIVTSREELDFVSKTYGVTWIGLSDKVQEGTWKWVDGTDLAGDTFWQDGEPNNSDGNEDCAEVSRSAKRFNDVPCSRRYAWVCED